MGGDPCGNMIAMVCKDGIVVSCLKQFRVEKERVRPNSRKAIVTVIPKTDAEFEKCVEIGEHPSVVMCGLGGQFCLGPILDFVAEKVLDSERDCKSRPSIDMLSRLAHNHAKGFLPHDSLVDLFIVGADKDIFGNLKLSSKYLNLSGQIDVPDMYIVGGQSELIRSQIGRHTPEDTDEAIELIKYGFACAARNEPDYSKGYIEIRVIKKDGVVIKDRFDDLEKIVREIFSPLREEEDEEVE